MTFSFLFEMRYAGRQPASLPYDWKIVNFAHKLAAKQEGIKAFRRPVFPCPPCILKKKGSYP
jgi:hypothetical protein